ncbi:glycosyl transferase family 90 [Campylobacter aviculae]|uniref:glycosyl transferase family 90 n=1 Tax=Campylobacter aviculae TaxID=2510190 RepID=UPI0022B6E7B9|nr:glycosyl transferase family 90 [Campylobacter aviculae]
MGDTGKHNSPYKKNFLSKKEQTKYKFIISLEGNDVASNLKWAMSSNSLVLSPKMTCETWFMEGKLKANEHFALIDNENLSELIDYFIQHPKQALEIINNAHRFIEQFLNKKREFHIGILVLAKYFYYSKQLELNQKEILEIIQ